MKQGIIRNIINIVLLNKDFDIQNKELVCEILDELFIEGIKLPSEL